VNQALRSETFHADLLARGVVVEGERIRRIIVVAEVGELVRIWVERFGDDRLLGVVPPGLELGAL
jgi:hypothetical protein